MRFELALPEALPVTQFVYAFSTSRASRQINLQRILAGSRYQKPIHFLKGNPHEEFKYGIQYDHRVRVTKRHMTENTLDFEDHKNA